MFGQLGIVQIFKRLQPKVFFQARSDQTPVRMNWMKAQRKTR